MKLDCYLKKKYIQINKKMLDGLKIILELKSKICIIKNNNEINNFLYCQHIPTK